MSLLREVIVSAEEIEIGELKVRIPQLKADVLTLKTEILNLFDNLYVEFLNDRPEKILEFMIKLKLLQEELDVLKNSLEPAIRKKVILGNAFTSVKESTAILIEMTNLCLNHENFLILKREYSKENYSEALRILKDLETAMSNCKFPTVTKYLHRPILYQKSTMFFHFRELIKSKYEASMKEKKTTSMLKVHNHVTVDDLIRSLYQYDTHITQLDYLVDFLWEFIFVPIITYNSKVTIADNELTVIITNRLDDTKYVAIFQKLFRVNFFLQNYLKLNIDEAKQTTLLAYIGNEWKDRLTSLLITQCLKRIKPAGENECVDYDEIIEDTKKLETEFKYMKLVFDGSLVEFTKNLQKRHLHQPCEVLLDGAKNLIDQKNSGIIENGMKVLNDSSDDSVQLRPVSSNVKEFLQLIENLLMQMKTSKEICHFRYFQTILDIFKYYRMNVRKQNEEMCLQNGALFYNNCIYIAQEVQEWNFFYSDALLSYGPPFKVEAFKFQNVGEETLNHFVNLEKTKLKDILNEGYFCKNTETQKDTGGESEKCVDKCLNHMRYLKDSWYNILSNVIYNKSIGIVFNVICEFLIKCVFNLNKNVRKNAVKKLSIIFDTIMSRKCLFFMESTGRKVH